ncbi:MAG: SAM-dependent methyltransferase [Actinomycetota bacterium]|nr:SAM-dependent methyltransferase [Actinomycetota bacterium]
MSGTTSLGMPVIPPPTTAPTWKNAWDLALYGLDGFFRRETPAAHFRTSVHASPLFAGALVALVRRAGLDTVVDIGAGRGELLTQLHAADPSLRLLGVEVAARPTLLDAGIDWTSALPESVEGLVVANEWLDNIPCHVVEVDGAGTTRVVHVNATTGEEALGAAVTDSSVPQSLSAWCASWWPLQDAEPGTRAEVGTTRDAAWADVVRRVEHGVAVAVDYGHVREDRPPFGSLRCYRDGGEVDVIPDGSRDVTAHVAVDSVAAQVGAQVTRQRDALRLLGVSGTRPDLALATAEPGRYLAGLAHSTEAAELTVEGGLGDFRWIVTADASLRDRLWR